LNERQRRTRDKTLALQKRKEAEVKQKQAAGRGSHITSGSHKGEQGLEGDFTKGGANVARESAGSGSDGDTVASLPPDTATRSRSFTAAKWAFLGRGSASALLTTAPEPPEAFPTVLASVHASSPASRTSSLSPTGTAGQRGLTGSKSFDNLRMLRQ
jgi:hypothetical protein